MRTLSCSAVFHHGDPEGDEAGRPTLSLRQRRQRQQRRWLHLAVAPGWAALLWRASRRKRKQQELQPAAAEAVRACISGFSHYMILSCKNEDEYMLIRAKTSNGI